MRLGLISVEKKGHGLQIARIAFYTNDQLNNYDVDWGKFEN